AGDAHQAAHALHDEVIAGAVRVRTRLPEAGDRAVDHLRIRRGEARVVEAVALEVAHLEVLGDDVALRGQLAGERLALGLRDVERHGSLAAVGGEIVGRLDGLSGFVAKPRRAPAARVVTRAGAFDLDHFGAEVGQDLRGR